MSIRKQHSHSHPFEFTYQANRSIDDNSLHCSPLSPPPLGNKGLLCVNAVHRFHFDIQHHHPTAVNMETELAWPQHLPVQLVSGLSHYKTTGSSGHRQHIQHHQTEYRAPPRMCSQPLLITLLTRDYTPMYSTNLFISLRMTTVVGLISNNNETNYRNKVCQLFRKIICSLDVPKQVWLC